MTFDRVIFHVDMDAFFASIEQRDNPELRGRPVIVGALPGNRGVVCAASYEARKFGVHSAMPVSRAHALCPEGAFIFPRHDRYSAVSREIMEIFLSFSPVIEQISVDEAFIDMSGTSKLHGTPAEAAQKLQNRVYDRLQLTCSVGVAPNKLLAKIASDMKKPRGITMVPFTPQEIEAWLAPLAVGRIWGVGEKTAEALRGIGAVTIGDIQKLSGPFLVDRFGAYGADLFNLCRGIDKRELSQEHTAKSLSREHTFAADCGDMAEFKRILLILARDVAFRAREQGLSGRTITLTWRLPDFSRHSRRVTRETGTDLARDLYATACDLLDKEKDGFRKLRLIGVGLSGFDESHRLDLFSNAEANAKAETTERAMDAVVKRFGESSIFLAGERKGGEVGKKRHPSGNQAEKKHP